ncbi:MAG: hypothetical protein K2N78_09950 [Oscillospiraceae bacterium]|nr:hypothetical protein [Oscillospiraceae bacterium]
MSSKEDRQSGRHGSGDEMEESTEYYSWQLNPILEEMRRLELQMFMHESTELLLMLREMEKPRPEDPDSEKA